MEILFSDKFVAILNQWRWYPVQKERMALFTLICQMRRLQARKFADSQPQAKSVVNHVSSRRMGRIENIQARHSLTPKVSLRVWFVFSYLLLLLSRLNSQMLF